MRTRHAASALLAASAAATLAACGGSSKDDAASGTPAASGGGSTEFVLAKAASATEQAKTAKISIEQRISGGGIPSPVTLSGTGVTSLTEPELDLTYDLGPILSLAGRSASGDAGKAHIIVDGSTLQVQPPKLPELKLPNGASWVQVDLRQAVTALGLDPDALKALAQFDPASQLKRLQSLKGIKKSGTTTIDGTQVTRYTGTVSAREAIATLPAAQRDKIEKAFGKLGGTKALDQESATEIDVDGDGLVRRQVTSSQIPAQGSTPGGKIDQTIDYSDFGTALDPDEPDASDVFDASKAIEQGLSGLASAGGGLGTTTTP